VFFVVVALVSVSAAAGVQPPAAAVLTALEASTVDVSYQACDFPPAKHAAKLLAVASVGFLAGGALTMRDAISSALLAGF